MRLGFGYSFKSENNWKIDHSSTVIRDKEKRSK
jgi:hypothetical protein